MGKVLNIQPVTRIEGHARIAVHLNDDGNVEVIPPEQLEASKNSMSLTDLKSRPAADLVPLGEELGLEGLARQRKQEMIFSILKAHAKQGEDIYGDGVLEILQDGFGFLRSADSSYLAGPDDIYVSPSQIRRFNLRTGDTISGKIRRKSFSGWLLDVKSGYVLRTS